MNKIDLIVRLSLIVLTTGLVSCAKDDATKTRDVFRAPPPVIHSGGPQSLKDWDRRGEKSLDLQDSFDVSAGSPAQLKVVSKCRRDQRNFTEEFSFVPRAPIKIFQVLPAEVLTADLKNVKHDCTFELTLINAAGSRHIFQISVVPMTDLTGGMIKLERAGSEDKIGRIHTRKLEGLRARFEDQGEAEILCADVTIAALPFARVTDLGSFNFSKPVPRPGRPEVILQESPLQSCRMLLRKNGRVEQLSDLLAIQFPQKPLIVSLEHVENPSGPQKNAFLKGAPLRVAIMTVRNQDKLGNRSIFIDSKPGEMSLEVYGYNSSEQGFTPAKYVIREDFLVSEPSGKITIPAGGSVQIALRLQPTRHGRWSSDMLKVKGRVPYDEIDESGEILGAGEISLPDTHLSNGAEADFLSAPPVPSPW